MVIAQALVPADVSTAVVVDLIGDLDATLGANFTQRLIDLTNAGTKHVHLTMRHVAVSSREGLGAIENAVARARERGCSVADDPGSRRMRAAFAAARIPFAPVTPSLPRRGRHVMLAHHAPPGRRLRKTA